MTICRDPGTGDMILSARNELLVAWLALRDRLISQAPDEFDAFDLARDARPTLERDRLQAPSG